MTLDEFMDAADKNDMYYIGAKDGFVMIVRPDEYKAALAEVNKTAKDALIRRCKADIDLLKAAALTCKIFADSKIIVSYQLKETADKQETLKEKAERQMLNLAKEMIDYSPIETREVIDVYERIGDGFAVIIKGTEHGAYWDRKEWETKHDKA